MPSLLVFFCEREDAPRQSSSNSRKPISRRQLRSEADTSKAPEVVEILLEAISPSPFLAQPSLPKISKLIRATKKQSQEKVLPQPQEIQ